MVAESEDTSKIILDLALPSLPLPCTAFVLWPVKRLKET